MADLTKTKTWKWDLMWDLLSRAFFVLFAAEIRAGGGVLGGVEGGVSSHKSK